MSELEKAPHPDNPNHNADGTFAQGNKLGAIELKGRTTWRKRVEQLDEKYNTVEKLLGLFDQDSNGKMLPGKDLMQMHPRDAALIMQALGAIVGDDKRLERESFLDRDEGKARQSISVGGDPENKTPIAMDGTFTLTFGTDKNEG